ncbi:MAG: hypothetical protein LVR00_04385 [Rhabdochlamydiaceae bacterium]|jgi:hypothetical protein
MFTVVYRGFIKAGLETAYQDYWKKVATYFVKEKGALGSILHKTKEGMWIAYSRWPDEATRAAAWPAKDEAINPDFPPDIQEAIRELKNCIETQLPEICMEIVREVK